MANSNILKDKVTVNFGEKTWSTSDILNTYPWALVGVESEAVLNGTTGGIDTYSNLTKSQWNANTDYSYCITVGDTKNHNAAGERGTGEGYTNVISGNCTINGGNYLGNSTAVYVAQGTCTINGGFFFAQPDSTNPAQSDAEREKYGNYRTFVLNCFDSMYKAGKASIVVKGGKFVNFDPADNYAEGDHTNFVPSGYHSTKLDETFTYMVKDSQSPNDGKLVSLPIWEVTADA